MSDLISRQTAIDAFERFIHELGIEDEPYNYGEMALSAQNVPSVENKGENRPKGHWIYPSYLNNYSYMWKSICSNCNAGFPTINKDYKYCPNCGADMRGE